MNELSLFLTNLVLSMLYSILCGACVYLGWWRSSLSIKSLQQWRGFWFAGIVCSTFPLLYIFLPYPLNRGLSLPILVDGYSLSVGQDLVTPNTTALNTQLGSTLLADAMIMLMYSLATIYCAGLIFKSATHFLHKRRINNIHSLSFPVTHRFKAELASAIAHIVDKHGLRKIAQASIEIRASHSIVTPFVVGYRRPTIFLPQFTIKQFNSNQLKLVIEHELTHFANRDPLLIEIVALMKALFWFNPFIHLLAQKLTLAIELHCDALILDDRPKDKLDYVAALVKVVENNMKTNSVFSMPGFGIFKRNAFVQRLSSIKFPIERLHKSVPAKCSLILVAALINLGSFWLHPAIAQDSVAGYNLEDLLKKIRSTKPVQTSRVSSGFGIRELPNTRQLVKHRGIDYPGKIGTPVYATHAGRIEFAGVKNAYGNLIVIRHTSQVTTMYAHLNTIAVKEGESVAVGTLLGEMGETGLVTGPHLHYELRVEDKPVCPRDTCNQTSALGEMATR